MAPLFGVEGSVIRQQNVGHGTQEHTYLKTPPCEWHQDIFHVTQPLPGRGGQRRPYRLWDQSNAGRGRTDSRRKGRGRGRRSSCSEHPMAATPPLCLPRTSASLVNKNSSSPAGSTAKQDVDRMDSEWRTRNAHRHVHSVLPSSAVVLLFGWLRLFECLFVWDRL